MELRYKTILICISVTVSELNQLAMRSPNHPVTPRLENLENVRERDGVAAVLVRSWFGRL